MKTMKDAAGATIDLDAEKVVTEELYASLDAVVKEKLPMHAGSFINAAFTLMVKAVLFADDPTQLAEYMSKKLVEEVAACMERASQMGSASRQ
jgi:hypothetical protein